MRYSVAEKPRSWRIGSPDSRGDMRSMVMIRSTERSNSLPMPRPEARSDSRSIRSSSDWLMPSSNGGAGSGTIRFPRLAAFAHLANCLFHRDHSFHLLHHLRFAQWLVVGH